MLSTDGYHSAIIRFATMRGDGVPTSLVFASIELVAAGRPKPSSSPLDTSGRPQLYRAKVAALDLAFRLVAMDAAEAVKWYRSLSDAPTIPVPSLEAERGPYDGSPLTVGPLIDEPTWPETSYPLSDSRFGGDGVDTYPTPFVGPGAFPARIHRRLAALSSPLERLLSDEAACRWLHRRIHFDVRRHDELLGGAVLVLPDPDVRTARTLLLRDVDGLERLLGEVRPRPGRKLHGLTMTMFEHRFGAASFHQTFKLDGDLLPITRPSRQLEQTGFSLVHNERGLVASQEALPFLRAISLTMETTRRRVMFETKDSRKTDAMPTQHEVPEIVLASSSEIRPNGEAPRSPDPMTRFDESVARRRAERLAREQQLQWFDDATKARSFVRGLIGRARELVMIVDPYCDGQDLYEYAMFVQRADVQVRVLTSRQAFEQGGASLGSFADAKAAFKARGMPEPDVRILRGRDNPHIHDRFLVVDQDVWLSGNSLNTLGARASVLVKIADAQGVRARLDYHFNEARPLAEIDIIDGSED